MGATSSFIIVVVVVVVIIFMIGCICFQNSKRIRESFNASNVLKNFINNEDGLKQQVDVQGHAGLEFLGTFVMVQVARDTPPTLIDEIAEVEDWECSEDGECTGTLTYEVPSGGKRESFDLALREGLAFDVDLPALAYLGFRGTYLIAMVDATTEPRLLPGISTFVPADETSCTPGDQCEGVVTYNGDGDDNGGEPGDPENYVISDEASCEAFGGSWSTLSTGEARCMMHNDSFLEEKDTLQVTNGVVLYICCSGANFTNQGHIEFKEGGNLRVNASSTLNNFGIIELKDVVLDNEVGGRNNGFIINEGTFNISSEHIFMNEPSGSNGEFYNSCEGEIIGDIGGEPIVQEPDCE